MTLFVELIYIKPIIFCKIVKKTRLLLFISLALPNQINVLKTAYFCSLLDEHREEGL